MSPFRTETENSSVRNQWVQTRDDDQCGSIRAHVESVLGHSSASNSSYCAPVCFSVSVE